jgi:hypothetical protein
VRQRSHKQKAFVQKTKDWIPRDSRDFMLLQDQLLRELQEMKRLDLVETNDGHDFNIATNCR